ncbi:hypothetical protein ACFOYW_08065 [Gryllotalpicola reticulitermitis]|uniref:Alternate-type signal peptide domain-containing protein n=1 Tax=Gryllotalpicola reticulitermitis TaxID=1184153 RepID=A0ABV8Q4I0_9MICO
MNKKSITLTIAAGTAGVALLAGGTTFALWRSSAGFDAGTVTNAAFAITVPDTDYTASWVGTAGTPSADYTNLVPGDTVENTAEVSVSLSGDATGTLDLTGIGTGSDVATDLGDAGLSGTAYIVPAADASGFDPSSASDVANSVAIVDLLTGDVPSTLVGGVALPDGVTSSYAVTAQSTGTYDAVIVLNSPSTATDASTAGKSVDLSQLGFELQQTPSGS